MMSPPAYLAYQRSAEHHLQVEVLSRGILEDRPESVPVKARVRRVFKSSSNIQPDDELSFGLNTFRMPNYPPPGAGSWIEYERFQKIRYMEVFLNGHPEALGIAAFGALHFQIDELTETPVFPPPGFVAVALASISWKYDRTLFGRAIWSRIADRWWWPLR